MKFLPASKKARIILIILALIVAILLVVFKTDFVFDQVGPPPEDPATRQQWLSDNIDNMNHNVFVTLDYEVPSWEELDALNASLPPRQYPRYIKATQTYGTLPNLVESLYFADVLKDLGINTQFIHANHWYRGGEFELWYQGYKNPLPLNQDQSRRALVHNILLARQQGIAVILFPDYVELEDGGMTKLKISDDLEEHLNTIALDLAEIAEKYQVEYLVPSNQIEMILHSNNYSLEETTTRTNAFYTSIVPEIKKVYTGKILYKMGGFGDWTNYDNISLEGADLFGFTGCYNVQNYSLDFIADDIQNAAKQANTLSRKYGIPWINAEFLVDDYENPNARTQVAEEDILPLEDYYEAGFAAFNRYASNASGFTIHSLLGAGKVYDTPAMPLIKSFFATK